MMLAPCLPLVFLHGWGLTSAVWAATMARFSPEVFRQAIDLPGYGDSPSITPYRVEALADAVAASITRPTALIGWSLGGMVAQALAARHPHKVARLVLVSTSPAFAARPDWPHAMAPALLDEFAHSLAEDFRATLLRFLSLQARGGDAARAVQGQLREQLRTQSQPKPADLAAGLELLRTVDLRDQAGRVGCPTLVVHGARDLLCPPEAGKWLALHLPNARLALHERAAHAPFLSHPDWCVAILKDFLHG